MRESASIEEVVTKIRKATRYIADCGRGFWHKQACLHHEKACKCWTNPKNQTCKTCFHADWIEEDYYSYYDCALNLEANGGPPGVDDISVNCTSYKVKIP